ncbi:MAG: hypothetical protein CNCCGFBP_02439 [Fimbriimonadaceae bacterium]|nr:hypothetical protein [Fimbriimonadaceae bacterium]
MRPRDLVEKWGPDTRRNVFLCSGCLLDSRRKKSNSRLVSFWGTSHSASLDRNRRTPYSAFVMKTVHAIVALGALCLAAMLLTTNGRAGDAVVPVSGRIQVVKLKADQNEFPGKIVEMLRVDRASGQAWSFWVDFDGSRRPWVPIPGGPSGNEMGGTPWTLVAGVYPGIERREWPVLYNSFTGQSFILQGLPGGIDPPTYHWIPIEEQP